MRNYFTLMSDPFAFSLRGLRATASTGNGVAIPDDRINKAIAKRLADSPENRGRAADKGAGGGRRLRLRWLRSET